MNLSVRGEGWVCACGKQMSHMKADHCRYRRNLCRCEKKAWKKKSGLYGIEPLTSTIRCSGRTTSLYLKKPRNRTGMRALTLQAFPDNWKQVMEFFAICMQHLFGYIMMDLHPASDHILFDCGRTSRKRTDLRSCIIAPHEVKKDRSQFSNGSLVCQ